VFDPVLLIEHIETVVHLEETSTGQRPEHQVEDCGIQEKVRLPSGGFFCAGLGFPCTGKVQKYGKCGKGRERREA
jgi:hypothetical protein